MSHPSWELKKRKMAEDPLYRGRLLAKKREAAKLDRATYPEKYRKRGRENYRKNRQACLLRAKNYKKLYQSDPVLKARSKRWTRNYYLKHQEKIKARHASYYKDENYLKRRHANRCKREKVDRNYYMRRRLPCLINIAIRLSYHNSKCVKLLGCSIKEARRHLEKQFKSGMTWENRREWHIDHIIPLCHFDLTKNEDQMRCFHYTNLQPLWPEENLAKGRKLPNET